ncbi:hypothetical protein D5086_024257 [Populus alba]|uniref:Uncharacterized protein n=1 Tax=Populus alba TaxID=43335 RepID=A0ACC4B4Y4_POPAL
MRDFPSCFGENGVQVADSSSSNTSKNAQNLVTCVYQCRIRGRSCLITITWSKNLMGQGLSVGIDDSANHCLSKFGSGPEPSEGFYVAVVVDRQMALFLGDMRKEAFKKTGATPIPSNSVFVAKREHVFGKKAFRTKAQFCDNGQIHDLVIECDTIGVSDPCLLLRVDCKTVMQVKQLRWKFRGNHTILVDGLAIELFWDVHNWLFETFHNEFLAMNSWYGISELCPGYFIKRGESKFKGVVAKWSIGYGARTHPFDTLRFFGPAFLCFGFRFTTYLDVKYDVSFHALVVGVQSISVCLIVETNMRNLCIYVTKEYMSNCDLQVTTAYKLRVVTVFTNIVHDPTCLTP